MPKKTLVIGAGLSGVVTALLLSAFGVEVVLVESKGSIFSGATSDHWYRLHTGLHHPEHPKFAEEIQATTLLGSLWMKNFIMNVPVPQYFVQESHSPLMGLDGDAITAARFLEVAEQLQRHYREMLVLSPEAEDIFGHPDDFFSRMELGNDRLGSQSAQLRVTSNERLIDLYLLAISAMCRIEADPNIEFRPNHLVQKLQPQGSTVLVEFLRTICSTSYWEDFDHVVNTTFWQEGQKIDQQVMKDLPSYAANQHTVETGTKIYAVLQHGIENQVTHLLQHGGLAPSYGRIAENRGVIEIPATALLHHNVTGWLAPSRQIAKGTIEPDVVHQYANGSVGHVIANFPFLQGAQLVGGYVTHFIHELVPLPGFYRGTGLPELQVQNYHSIRARKLPNAVVAAHEVILNILRQKNRLPEQFQGHMDYLSMARFIQWVGQQSHTRLAPAKLSKAIKMASRLTPTGIASFMHSPDAEELEARLELLG